MDKELKPKWTPKVGDKVLIKGAEVYKFWEGPDGVHAVLYKGGQQINALVHDLLPVPDPATPTVEDYIMAALREMYYRTVNNKGYPPSPRALARGILLWFPEEMEAVIWPVLLACARQLRAERKVDRG